MNPLRRLRLGTPVAAQIADLVDARLASANALAQPSPFWAHFIRQFSYVFELSATSLDQIRLHTFHLTSDIYLRYVLTGGVDEARVLARYAELSAAVGSRALAEPLTGIGYPHPDGLVSWDTLRYLSVLGDLLDARVLPRSEPCAILEIGGGYGGLCRMVSAFNPRARYTIVDLEETLFFSKTYLDRTLPGLDVRLVTDPADIGPAEGRIHLVPQQFAEALVPMRFDLAVNHSSMQEMRVPQIERYLRLIAGSGAVLYSRNLSHHDFRLALIYGLALDVDGLLLEWLPDVRWRSAGAIEDGLLDEARPRLVLAPVDAPLPRLSSSTLLPPSGHAAGAIEDRPLHTGEMLGTHGLVAGSSFALHLVRPTAAVMLTFITWNTVVPRVSFTVVARAADGRRVEMTVTHLDLHDWESLVFDLRAVAPASAITLEITVLALEESVSLGLPLFPTAQPPLCRLQTGRPETDQWVPAGRSLGLGAPSKT